MRWHPFISVSKGIAVWASCALVLSMLSGVASAGELAGSGDRLQMLRKIQGRWQSACIKAEGSSLYQRQTLQFSFTQLHQHIKRFAGSGCTSVVDQQQYSYRYTLREPVVTAAGRHSYALNLISPDERQANALHPLNIIHYSDGSLLLGRADSAGETARLSALDSRRPFTRP